MTRSLDQKLAAIRANPQSTREFILADAKDADMAFGVSAYHGVLQAKKIKPHRSLEEDLQSTGQAMSHDGSVARRATVEIRGNPLKGPDGNWPLLASGAPDFERMNSAQRLAYDRARMQGNPITQHP